MKPWEDPRMIKIIEQLKTIKGEKESSTYHKDPRNLWYLFWQMIKEQYTYS